MEKNTQKQTEKVNPMCENCGKFGGECQGTTEKVWTGCVYRTVKEYSITQTERNRIAGRFMKVSENPLVIGLLGSLHARDLTPAQMAHIKAYYNASGKDHEIKKEFPVEINRSMYNDFIIIK